MPKRYRELLLPLAMLAVAALLAMVLLGQWLHYRHQEADLEARLAAKVEAKLPEPTEEVESFSLPGLEDYQEMVERPLFLESRRPVPQDETLPDTAEEEKRPLTVKLMGTVLTPGSQKDEPCDNLSMDECARRFIAHCAEKTAAPCESNSGNPETPNLGLFVDQRGKFKRLRRCGEIDGWRLVALQFDRVIMEQDGKCEELKVLKPKPKKPPMPALPAGLPGQPPGLPPGQMPGQPPIPPNNPEIPAEPDDSAPPNEAVDESTSTPEENANGQ